MRRKCCREGKPPRPPHPYEREKNFNPACVCVDQFWAMKPICKSFMPDGKAKAWCSNDCAHEEGCHGS